jgi:hypothetical protein
MGEGLEKVDSDMAAIETFIRDRGISVLWWVTSGKWRKSRRRSAARAEVRVGINVRNVVSWKLCKRNCWMEMMRW